MTKEEKDILYGMECLFFDLYIMDDLYILLFDYWSEHREGDVSMIKEVEDIDIIDGGCNEW